MAIWSDLTGWLAGLSILGKSILVLSTAIAAGLSFLLTTGWLRDALRGIREIGRRVYKVIRVGSEWALKKRSVAAIEEASRAPDTPELDPRAPILHFQVANPSILEDIERTYLSAKAVVTGRRLQTTVLVRAVDSPESYEIQAMAVAARTRGLSFLPEALKDPIQLQIARRYLTKAHAPEAAIKLVEGKLSGLPKGGLFEALFSPTRLAQVDSAKVSDADYFTKYFQPLMVNFSERSFVVTGGETQETERDVLAAHLNHFASGRVVALTFAEGAVEPSEERALAKLPVEIPQGQGKGRQRKRMRIFNNNKAACAVVVVCDEANLNRARAFEIKASRRMDEEKTEVPVCTWTPDIDKLPEFPCFLWQRPGEAPLHLDDDEASTTAG